MVGWTLAGYWPKSSFSRPVLHWVVTAESAWWDLSTGVSGGLWRSFHHCLWEHWENTRCGRLLKWTCGQIILQLPNLRLWLIDAFLYPRGSTRKSLELLYKGKTRGVSSSSVLMKLYILLFLLDGIPRLHPAFNICSNLLQFF